MFFFPPATIIVRHTVVVLVRRRVGLVADHQHDPVCGARVAQSPATAAAAASVPAAAQHCLNGPVQSGHVVAAGPPLQGQPAGLRVRPGLATAGVGRVAVRAQEYQTALVPQTPFETQHRQQVLTTI